MVIRKIFSRKQGEEHRLNRRKSVEGGGFNASKAKPAKKPKPNVFVKRFIELYPQYADIVEDIPMTPRSVDEVRAAVQARLQREANAKKGD